MPKLALYLAKGVRRLLDPQHATKAERIQAAFAVLGKQVAVEVRRPAPGRVVRPRSPSAPPGLRVAADLKNPRVLVTVRRLDVNA